MAAFYPFSGGGHGRHLLEHRAALAPRVGCEEGVVTLPVACVRRVEGARPLRALRLAPRRGAVEAARHGRARDALRRAVLALCSLHGLAAGALVGVGAEGAVAAQLGAGRDGGRVRRAGRAHGTAWLAALVEGRRALVDATHRTRRARRAARHARRCGVLARLANHARGHPAGRGVARLARGAG